MYMLSDAVSAQWIATVDVIGRRHVTRYVSGAPKRVELMN